MEEKNNISVIVPTLNAKHVIENLAKSLKKQSLYPFEILVIDSSSDDNTVELAKKNGFYVHVIKREEFNHGGTRRLGAHLAKGDILVYITQDVVLEKADTIETLINEFNDPSIACSYGRQIAKDNTDPIEMFTRNFNYPEKSAIKSKDLIRRMGIKTVFCSNSFGAYRKFVLLDVGNFPENIIFGEDMYVAGKIILAGYKVAYVAEACVYHSHNNTLIQEFKRNFDIGVFHTREKWLLENFSFTNKEGYKFVFSLFKYSSIKRPFWFIKAVLYVFCRFIAYNLGRREKIIPICLKKKLCMSKYYWN